MKLMILVGTVRDSTPPDPPRLGMRVAHACMNHLKEHQPDHRVSMIDPLDFSLGGAFKPHFAYRKAEVPERLEALAREIEAADGYVMVSPEYNHSMSPALAHLLNHFGSSLFSYKPSAIVTYSAGQWGGVRAAVAMRTFLSELGCLPVSAMIHVPEAQKILTEQGAFQAETDATQWQGYFGRTLEQLTWWAEATRTHRQQDNPFKRSKAFRRSPTQRNAPTQDS